ncbi:alpha/beta hydrolase [bacterium]|nr:alpha/beta hydrolase [bacterium]
MSRRRIKTGPKILVLLVLVGAVYGLWHRLERIVTFGPSRAWGDEPSSVGLDHEEDLLAAPGGLDLRAWYIPAGTNATATATNAAVTVLALHDIGETISDSLPVARVFHDLGLNVFLPEYRGFGGNPGRPTEDGLTMDALAAYYHLTARRSVPPEHLMIYGHGVGASVAMELATQVKAAGLITDSAFTSLGERVSRIRKGSVIPWDLLLRQRFAGLARIGRVHMPVLFLHGTHDPLVPLRQAEYLFAACRVPKELVPVDEVSPGEPLVAAATSREAIRAFLAKYAGDQTDKEPAASPAP